MYFPSLHANLSEFLIATSTTHNISLTHVQTIVTGATERKSCPPQIHTRALSLSDAPPRAVTHSYPTPCLSPAFAVCPSKRKSAFPPLHLLSSPLLHECWGVGGGRPRAGHPVRGLLTIPGLSAGAYWREIHINTCLLCLPPLDTARLPAWHRQHCMGLLSRTERGWGFNASVALECGPPDSPPVALMDLSRQCRV